MSEASSAAFPRYLDVPAENCLNPAEKGGWVGTVVVAVGPYHVAVRAGSRRVYDALHALFGRHVVHDPNAPASYAVAEGAAPIPSARPLFQVLEGCSHFWTTPSLERAIEVVGGQLERLLPRDTGQNGGLELAMGAIVGPEAALLTPWSLPYRLPRLELELSRSGLRVLERYAVRVEPSTGELLLPAPRLVSLERGGSLPTMGTRAAGPVTERRPLVGWVVFDRAGASLSPSRASALAQAFPRVYEPGSPRERLRSLATLVTRTEIIPVRRDADVVTEARRYLAGDGR